MAKENRRSNRKTATMRDVATLANVSQSTVSRVLSGISEPIAIGEDTRQRVMEAVEKLKYQPNLHAGSLRGQKTRMIAIMIADITNSFYHPMIRAVQDIAYANGYDIMIANTDHTNNGEIQFIKSVLRRPVDGIVMVPYHLTDDDLEELIERTGAAVVAVGQHLSHPDIDIAFSNDEQSIYDVVTWLHKEKGHSNIGFIGVSNIFPVGLRRRRGYQEALIDSGLALESSYDQIGDWSVDGGCKIMRQFLSLPTPPTAVIACNDLMAIGAIEAAKGCGLTIPDDVAIVGFDDIPAASWVTPRLSTIAQKPGEMGRRLTKALFERIDGTYYGLSRRIEIPSLFIEREST